MYTFLYVLLQKRYALKFKSISSLVLIFFLHFPVFANDTVSGDKDYYKHDNGQYSYIYPKEYRELIQPLVNLQEIIEQEYQASFAWQLDEKMSLVLASDQNQIANGFATNFPSLRTVFYGGGAGFLDYFASSSWLNTLYVHEVAHLYQLNPKQELGKFSYKIFGNNPFLILPFIPIPVVPMPNIALPSWMLEGNAVVNESRLGMGGRLYSGEFRSSFYSLLKKGKTNLKSVTNNNLDYPFQEENYLVGSHIFLYIAKKYGVDKANQFFYAHSTHYINPFLISNTMEKKFGKSYKELVEEALASYKKNAKKQKDLKGKIITKSVRRFELNEVDGKVVFLSSDDDRYFKTLNIYDPKTGQLEKSHGDYVSGKVFKHKGQWVTAGSHQLAHNKISFGLWFDGAKQVEGSADQLVLDIKNNKKLYIDMKKNFGNAKLKINGLDVGTAHSRAILDKNNHAVFFKQNADTRYLVRGNETLFKFKGYYAKVVGVGANDSIYFIASTKYGSSLFQYENGQSYRLSNADNIIDALKVKNGFVALTTGSKGVEFKLFKPGKRQKSIPHQYKYFFEKERSFKIAAKNKKENKKRSKKKQKHKESNYNSITNLRYDAMNVLYSYSTSDGNTAAFNIGFSDPIGFNTLNYSFLKEESDSEEDHRFTYLNFRHRLNYGFGLKYEKNEVTTFSGPFDEKIISPFLILGFKIWQKERSKLSTKIITAYEDHNRYAKNEVELYANLNYKFKATASEALLPLRLLNSKIEFLKEREGNTYTFANHFSYGFKSESFIQGSLVGNVTDSGELELGEGIRDESLIAFSELTAYSSRSKSLKSIRAGLAFKQVIEAPILSWYLPVGLRRLVPGVVFNHVKYGLDLERSYNDYGLTLDSELLLNHQAPVTIGLEFLEKDFSAKSRSIALKLNHLY